MLKSCLNNGLLYPLRFLPGSSRYFGPPRRIMRSAWDYYKQHRNTDQQCIYHRLSIEQEVDRKMPKHADESIAVLFKKMRQGLLRERFVVELPKGRYWGRGYGYVITQDDVLLHDLSPTFYDYGSFDFPLWQHDGLSRIKLPSMDPLWGNVVVLNTLFCSNFHHWLLDTLPKIQLLKQAGLPLNRMHWFVFDYKEMPYQDEALKRLGIPLKKIVPSHPHLHFQADRLIVPSYSEPGAHADWYNYTPEGMAFVNELFLGDKVDNPPEPHRKILLSRSRAKFRRWIEEDEAWPHLESLGFERHYFEDYTVAQQAALFQEASVVVMPHGGGLANSVFCQPGTKIIELFNPRYLPTFMMTLCDNRKLQYYALVGEPTVDSYSEGGFCDISVDPERVFGFLG